MWSCGRRALLVVVGAVVLRCGLASVSGFRRVFHGVRISGVHGAVVDASSLLKCGSLCRATQCFAWSWVPEERQCTHYNSFISSSLTYTPNPSVHTYVTLAPAPDLEYLVFKGKRMSWRQSQETCSGVGAVLAYRRDFQWLKSLQRLHDVEGFFLGLTKNSLSDPHWRDESGEIVLTNAISWAESEPSEEPEELCVVLQSRMKTVDCDKKIDFAFLCKMQV